MRTSIVEGSWNTMLLTVKMKLGTEAVTSETEVFRHRCHRRGSDDVTLQKIEAA